MQSVCQSQGDVEQMIKVEQNVEAVSPKCIGPGCSSDALPESVYCGHRCIVQHAAVAIKTLSEPKTEVKSAAVPAELSLKVNIIMICLSELWWKS